MLTFYNIKGLLWHLFYLTDNGYIEGNELDDFFRHMMKRLGPEVSQLCLCSFCHNV